MTFATTVISALRRNDEGQDLLEYGLLMSLIAITAMGAVTQIGQTILTVFWEAIAATSV